MTPRLTKTPEISILIPTYNRHKYVIKNLVLINELIAREGLALSYKVLISDNNSSDKTVDSVRNTLDEISLDGELFCQETNIGLERNALFLLHKSRSEYVMFLGDDDYIPDGYLTYVVQTIKDNPETCAVVPGFSNLFADGSVTSNRVANFPKRHISKGFLSIIRNSQYGHQLSGLVLRRDQLYDTYVKDNRFHNIYLFIFFLGYNIKRGSCSYAPRYQVLVSQENAKDWRYDDSGLLTEIFKNYYMLYGYSMKSLLCCLAFTWQQSWRLRISRDLRLCLKSFAHLLRAKSVHPVYKFVVPLIYALVFFRTVLAVMAKPFRLHFTKFT